MAVTSTAVMITFVAEFSTGSRSVAACSACLNGERSGKPSSAAAAADSTVCALGASFRLAGESSS